MMNLNKIYNAGTATAEMPPAGRYSVSVKIHSVWQIILEKTINITGQGYNHPPIFFVRHFNLPFMDFNVSTDIVHKEVVFTYKNGFLIDRLRKRKDKNEWIGKVCIDGKFIRYFILRRK